MKRIRQEQGFVRILIVLVLVALVGAIGWAIYSRKDMTNTTNTAGSTHTADNNSSTSLPDPYAGWKLYCDGVYRFCFKYPADWSISADTGSKLGDTLGATVSSPEKTILLTYINQDTHDVGVLNFNTVDIAASAAANQTFSIVGGYAASSGLVGNYSTLYELIDTATLSRYPLTKGQASQFPNNPMFTDKDTSQGTYNGSLRLRPMAAINTVAEAQAWFNASSTKTGLLILKSAYFQ